MAISDPDPQQYRRRASRLAQYANLEPDCDRKWLLLEEALSWIVLAENEELLTRAGVCRFPPPRRRGAI